MIGRKLPQLEIPNWLLFTMIALVLIYTVVRNVLKFI